MAVNCIVPASPPKLKKSVELRKDENLSRRLPAHSTMSAHVRAGVQSLLSVAVQSTSQGATFRSISASANRDALKIHAGMKKRKADQSEFSRDPSATFIVASTDEAESAPRDEAFRVIETLAVSTQSFAADEADPHFLKLEPNSKIVLRKRLVSHLDLQGHLESRTFVPISKLFSIARPQKSDDGDFTLPVDGDWLTIGVLTSKVKRTVRLPVMLDYNDSEIDEHLFQQRWQAYKQRKGDAPETLDDEDNPYRDVKEVQPALECISATLTDLGQPLVRNETVGDSQIELTLFQSSNERKACDHQKQAFTVMDQMCLGSVVCLLNPLLKRQTVKTHSESTKDNFLVDVIDRQEWRNKVKDDKSQKGKDAKMRLQARKGEAILAIGMAAEYKTCSAMCRNGQLCDNFVDARSKLSACPFHMYSAASRHRTGRQEFANGTFSFFSASDAPLFGSKPRTYVSQSGTQDRRPTNPTSSAFRVEQRYGREKELKRLREEKMKAEDAVRDHLQSKCTPLTVAHHSRSKPQSPPSVIREAKSSGNGAKAVDDAMRALLKSRGVKDLDAALGTRPETSKDRRNDHTVRPDGSSSVLDVRSSRLLTRHTAPTQSRPKPILRVKKSIHSKSAVRPPPGESFHACDSSDDELDLLVAGGAFDSEALDIDDEDSDLEIVH